MRRQKIVIANWKMNLSVPESSILLEKYLAKIEIKKTEVVVCPSFVDIYSAEETLKKTQVKVGAQNVYFEEVGPFTGEVSAIQLKGFAKYCVVGHSERRQHFGETDKVVAKKAAVLVRHGIIPIICVGENLHEHMDGLTNLVVAGQTEASLSELTGEEIAESVIAYEPVWAIGTGQTDSPKEAGEAIRKIRNLIKVLHGEKVSESVRVVYGGSVNSKNAKGLLEEDGIDGLLIGGASLSADEFAKIVAEAEGKKEVEVKTKKRVAPKEKKKVTKSIRKKTKEGK